MKLLRVVTMLAVAAAALLALGKSGMAQDNTCVLNCNTTKKDCLQQARTDALACKQACRDNSAPTDLGACNRLCAGDFRSKKNTCRDDHKTCHEGCGGNGPPENQDCLKGCAKDFASCARDTGKSTKDCVGGCRTAADHSSCMQGCADSAKGLSAGCATTLETCRTNCGSPAPTPSGS
jgi:hypothetical protein